MVFEISSFILKTIGIGIEENNSGYVKKLAHYPYYLVLSHDSYIIQDDLGNITLYGLSELCSPVFPAAKEYINSFLLYIFGSLDPSEPQPPEVREVDQGLINGEYVQTINGPQLVSEYMGSPLDRSWYRKKLLYYREMLLPFLP